MLAEMMLRQVAFPAKVPEMLGFRGENMAGTQILMNGGWLFHGGCLTMLLVVSKYGSEYGIGIHEHTGTVFIPNPQTCTIILQSLVSLIIRITKRDHLPISDIYSESIRSVDWVFRSLLASHIYIVGFSVRSLSNLYALPHVFLGSLNAV